MLGHPINAPMEATLMILPPSSRSTILAATAWERAKTPFRLMWSTRSQSDSDMVRMGFSLPPVPELFTRISMCPNSWITWSTRLRISSFSVMSQRPGKVFTPVLRAISSQAAWHSSSLRAAITMLAPASARPSAMPLPMPVAPPVTMATLPVRSK